MQIVLPSSIIICHSSTLCDKPIVLALSLYRLSIISFMPSSSRTILSLQRLASFRFHHLDLSSILSHPSLCCRIPSLSYSRVLSWKISHPPAAPQQETDAGLDSTGESALPEGKLASTGVKKSGGGLVSGNDKDKRPLYDRRGEQEKDERCV